MGAAAGVGAAVAIAPAVTPGLGSPAAAAPPPGRLVVVFLRGGIDGLSACVPYNEANYYATRPGIAIPAAAATDLDGQFGLHPALAPVHGLYTDGRFAFVNAVGNPAANRSHFEAQAFMEQGTAGHSGDGFGWLARHLNSSSGFPGAEFRAVGLGANSVRSLGGYGEALVIPSLERFSLGGVGGLSTSFTNPLHLLYVGDSPADDVGTNTLQAVKEISGLVTPNPGGGAYDDTTQAFDDALALLGADLGIEVITINAGGWDTHDNMGDETSGEMYDLLAALAGNLHDFQVGLDAAGHGDVTTLLMSDFGRRVAQNGSGGCDHGYGNIMMAMGAGIAGNQVHGTWPGLDPGDLVSGDLDTTTDFRDVMAEVVRDRLGNTDLAAVLPGHTATPVGLTV
jgi:uncharacterized protein (DUF1501 family)